MAKIIHLNCSPSIYFMISIIIYIADYHILHNAINLPLNMSFKDHVKG